MVRRTLRLAGILGAVAFATACAGNPESPVSPSAAETTNAANPDGSMLKVSAPALVSPGDGTRVDSIRPSVVFANSQGRFGGAAFSYRLQVFDAAGGLLAEFIVPQDGSGQTTFAATADQPYDTEIRWRVRAELDGQGGPWSPVWSFRTPQRVVLGDPSGSVGEPRSIQFNEAFDIIITIHNTLRIDLGSRSSREFRVDFLNAAVAAIHYGHPRFNPRGPDPSWCVKDAGGGRPQSDDVLVLCRSRDAWDLIGSAGANGYFFHRDYLGVLPSNQNVYPPPRGALNFLNR